MYLDKNKVVGDVLKSIGDFKNGYWITLNSFTQNEINYEANLQELCNCLNDFCYGRQYRNDSKRLKIIAGIERGSENEKIHSHLIVTHMNDTDRSFVEIEQFVRKRWYRLIESKGTIQGNMVDVQPIGNIESRIQYAIKDINSNSKFKSSLVFL